MNRIEIEQRINEIRPQVDVLIKEEYALRDKLKEFDTEKFKEFLVGKKFRVGISDDYRRIYLVNSEFGIK